MYVYIKIYIVVNPKRFWYEIDFLPIIFYDFFDEF